MPFVWWEIKRNIENSSGWSWLFSTLEMEDGPIVGTNMTMEKNDDNICFTVSYNCFFIYDEEKPIMNKYDFTIEEEVIWKTDF